ncbi:hypothetical protein LX32DRAFT_316220 [Colletotrichum zoysiae]|uniref:C2H2-type domain-containing protein n=1 Tax=Colletotrichum zoysiae TaxID=1216348 RepID=A0AAD9M1G1_9PEZI|nr:hypothetical protein LX32DRAFT_316220 [Colletotrichum zoysiae]
MVVARLKGTWKKHLFQDLRPYICLEDACPRNVTTFLTKQQWTDHLSLEHSEIASPEIVDCRICLQNLTGSMVQITTHLARHLEEIALSVLPTSPDSEEGMDDDSQLSSRDGSQLDGLAKPNIETEAESDAAGMDVEPTYQIRLIGGIVENGRPAELVRVFKDGKAIYMATGLEVDLDDTQIKRSLSQQLEDDEEIMRDMARRKKTASPGELGTPTKCREPGCNKEFKRPCDLTKHEKTHFRPWKCPVKSCKYHEYGWPTQKEMDRHHNDKHLSAPPLYECLYKPCTYKSKRESNCNQHMEKAHGWTYVRKKKSIGKSAP